MKMKQTKTELRQRNGGNFGNSQPSVQKDQ